MDFSGKDEPSAVGSKIGIDPESDMPGALGLLLAAADGTMREPIGKGHVNRVSQSERQ